MTTWNPQNYHRHSSEQQKWAHELIEKLHLTGDEHLLDIGCGEGKVTTAIASRLRRGRVVGVDKSNEMVSFARMNFPASNLTFMQMDASALTFDAQFDVVFSNAALHWIVDHRPVLRGIASALTSGGRSLLQMGGKANAAEILEVVTAVMQWPEWREYFAEFQFHYGFYAPDEYREWLIEAGLEPQRLELIPKDMAHPSIDAFAGWIRTTWIPWIQSVPESRREEFIAAVVKSYVSQNLPDEQGRVHVNMVRLEVEAAKR
jgi:trans-aconitate methyltransferase